ncbi:MAG: LppX_LprAFG lipoprotein [Pseudonocardia sp.]|nr:LppX_LprAFG lipoprotein [Pseudonocardia sp.]
MASRSPRWLGLITLLLAILALALSLTGCAGPVGSAPPPERLPPAPELLTRSADAMAKVKTMGVDLHVDPVTSRLPLRSATGKVTAEGEAVGSVILGHSDSPVEFQFVVTHGDLYLKGATGPYQRLPLTMAASLYDPTALLRPDTGVAALLRTATGGVTEASESVAGVPAYRVRANFDPQLIGSVLPGLTGATSGRVWIDKASSRLLKTQLDLPANERDPATSVIVTLTDFDAPVNVTVPTTS